MLLLLIIGAEFVFLYLQKTVDLDFIEKACILMIKQLYNKRGECVFDRLTDSLWQLKNG